MSEQDKMTPSLDDTGIRNYTVLCLGCLSLLLLALLRRGAGPWSFLPVAVGLLSVWQYWRVGPFLTLITLVILLIWHDPVGDIPRSSLVRSFRLPDWILCIAVLGYMIGQYRLQSLTHAIMPADPRRQRGLEAGQTAVPAEPPEESKRHRDANQAQAGEIGWVLMAMPICALFAQVAWRLLPGTTSWSRNQDFSGNWRLVVQGIVIAWVLAVGLFVARGLLRYLGWQQQSARAARLTLQDTYWQETRREQRRISHWLAWARLRRRKERS